MNRKRRMAKTKKNNGKLNILDPRQSQKVLENASVSLLIMGINNTLEMLEKRGIIPRDFDQKDRKLYRLKIIRGQVYFLAAAEAESGMEK